MKIDRLHSAAAYLTVLLALAGTTSSETRGQTESATGKNSGITPAQARNKVDEITRDLRDARAAAGKISEKAVREKIERILSQAELRARDLSNELGRSRGPQSPPAPLIPMPSATFEKLMGGLKKEPFDDGKLNFVENFVAKGPLSCQQAAAFLKNFAFDEGRSKAVKVLYPKLVDPQNFNDVLDVFIFDRSKVEVRKSVGLK